MAPVPVYARTAIDCQTKMASDSTRHVSFVLSRPGLLPGYQVKRRLVCLDTTYLCISNCCLFASVLVALYFGDLYWKQRHPNGLPLDPRGTLIDLFLISTGIVIVVFIVANLVRFVAKQIVILSNWFTPDEIRTFPIDTDGHIWSWRSPKAPLKSWPVEWQEPIPTPSSGWNE